MGRENAYKKYKVGLVKVNNKAGELQRQMQRTTIIAMLQEIKV